MCWLSRANSRGCLVHVETYVIRVLNFSGEIRDPIIKYKKGYFLRNGPDKNDSNNGNEHVGMQKTC